MSRSPEQEREREQEAGLSSIGRKAGRGLGWSLLGTLVTKIGSLAMGLVLARLLAPADFGLYAIALAASQFVMHINDAGIIAATVQWRGKLEDMAPTAAVLAVSFSTAVYGIFWVIAPAFARLAGNEAATPVVRLLTVIILVDGLTAVRSGALLRRFEQDKLTKANMVGFVANAALAIPLAAAGAGAYSFATGQVAASVVTGVLVFLAARLPVRIAVDREIAARLLRFGLPLAGSLGIESVLVNADYVIVGDALGPVALGYYLLAFNVSSWVPGLVGTAVRYVSVAGFSRLAENDPESLDLGVRRTVPLLVAGVLPAAVLMCTLAHEIVVFLYGAKWAPAADALRFLAVLMVVRMFVSFAFDILTSVGATKWTVWVNLGWAVALVAALLAGTRMDGIRGTAIGHAVVAVLVALPLTAWALNRAGVRLRPVLPGLVRPLCGAALAALVITMIAAVSAPLTGDLPVVELSVAGSAGLLVYILVVVPMSRIRQLTTRVVRLI
ncbi:oligosaccharide flippase family protein [Sphaerimonospora thailandensis]|uniref:Lipopolysaccharide biosynthesis protein n=1 Tax=Sphaerimonospora thailandensis TaxID=795644 RepID=A0A8J3VYJ3_9ACTN|nr:oligosaccharide flippase family protein [Sphaerimonospora thailandensis]GIH69063.1 lipopolysaccharide biosynthesis protein [Sphaerimonospora thailandensis]